MLGISPPDPAKILNKTAWDYPGRVVDSADRIGSPSAGSTRTVGNPYGIAAGCERASARRRTPLSYSISIVVWTLGGFTPDGENAEIINKAELSLSLTAYL
jgi:hypothetical protein